MYGHCAKFVGMLKLADVVTDIFTCMCAHTCMCPYTHIILSHTHTHTNTRTHTCTRRGSISTVT